MSQNRNTRIHRHLFAQMQLDDNIWWYTLSITVNDKFVTLACNRLTTNLSFWHSTPKRQICRFGTERVNAEVLFRSLNSVSICFSSSLFILKNVLDFNTTSFSCYNTNRISAFSTHISSLFMGICTHFHIFRLSQETIMIIYHGNL